MTPEQKKVFCRLMELDKKERGYSPGMLSPGDLHKECDDLLVSLMPREISDLYKKLEVEFYYD